MVISASRRTDLPAFHSSWFFDRLEEGVVSVRNPYNHSQVREVSLSPDQVEGIVFWTKNPLPMLPHLDKLRDYSYYFQFTLTPYGSEIEKNIPSKSQVLLPAFRQLSRLLGPERVIWRYDPILLSSRYTPEFHRDAFERMAAFLSGYTNRCVISFLDFYRNTASRLRQQDLLPMEDAVLRDLAGHLAESGRRHGIRLETCCEEMDLSEFGIGHGCCIDASLLEQISGRSLKIPKDKNQRKLCGCAASVDIGSYGTCPGGCLYCYAHF